MAKIKTSKVYPEYVFTRIGAGYEVNAIDHTRKQYVVLTDIIVSRVQGYINRANSDNSVEFVQVEYVEE